MDFRAFHSKVIISLTVAVLIAMVIFGYISITSSTTLNSNTEAVETILPYQNSALSTEERVDDLIHRMTLDEKIGQMALIENKSINDPNDITNYGLGGLLSGGGGQPNDNTAEGWFRMIQEYQSYTVNTRLGIPLLYGIDANHGHGNVPGATIFPHFIGLGASKDPALVRDVAKATAEEVTATGVNWVYSPNLDIVQDTRWGRTYETFGLDPELVGRLGAAYIQGLQSSNNDGIIIAAAAKHYIGNGASEWGSSTNKDYFIDQGNSTISENELREVHLQPFKQAVKADVKTIMVGLNNWDGEKISVNTYLLTDVLRKELGFQGLVFSDWYGVYENENDKYTALTNAINAGIDMVMLPYDYTFFSESMREALTQGDIDESRIDEAVRRILKVKFEIGLFDNIVGETPDVQNIGSEPHRELARMAVRKSLVLLKNKNDTLPIAKNPATILVAGSAADNIGKQSGGWTVEWQGIDGNWIPGTTILQGIKNTVSTDTVVQYEAQANFTNLADVADVGIAVVGENPYAEGWGDNENPQLSVEDIETIYKLRKTSKKIVVIIISGRPLDIKEHTSNWDAVIAAWLPGSEGQGIADVLFGDYPFTGTLPVDWDI